MPLRWRIRNQIDRNLHIWKHLWADDIAEGKKHLHQLCVPKLLSFVIKKSWAFFEFSPEAGGRWRGYFRPDQKWNNQSLKHVSSQFWQSLNRNVLSLMLTQIQNKVWSYFFCCQNPHHHDHHHHRHHPDHHDHHGHHDHHRADCIDVDQE